ncbi:hypothetical protein [Prauserella rugosa]|uniref:Uncharacterized protein n=1 Tax=Prauserella rugosa TaxID=43354 RepID=A0A660CBX1_9PSEU|nr:hypothetical protein [Prauserella rugosa]KID29656.1 hypothetical protein HQ32_03070 [Prauserella sp. Am3]KMS87195.1 hypothetical protein ACZ91_32685 [Streptomyces regensis]TWH18421.1 hypothetical protein JD82_00238 [Prauserella rugosa]
MSTVARAAATIPTTAPGPLAGAAAPNAAATTDVIGDVVVTGIGLIGTGDVMTVGGAARSAFVPTIEVREHASVTELVGARARALAG